MRLNSIQNFVDATRFKNEYDLGYDKAKANDTFALTVVPAEGKISTFEELPTAKELIRTKVNAISKELQVTNSECGDENEVELSELRLTSDGLFEERWDNIINIPARLIELGDDFAILECIVDLDSGIIENRKFERCVLEGAVTFKALQPILITVFKRSGQIRFTFKDNFQTSYSKHFEKEYFLDTPQSGIFSKKL